MMASTERNRTVNSLVKGVIFFIVVTAIHSLIIPDKLQSDNTLRLVYYAKKGTFYEADRLCRHHGGFLVLVDSQEMVETMQSFEAAIGSISDPFTRMIRNNSTEQLVAYDDTCQPVDTTSWSNWESDGDKTFDAAKQCFRTKTGDFTIKREDCGTDHEFVCEYRDPCNFQMSDNITLAALPAQNASMQLCQDMCDQMIGCFATAPSGVSTLPPYTMCLFILVNDTTNPMSSRHCPNRYERDTVTDPTTIPFNGTDPDKDPNDCYNTTTVNTTPSGSRLSLEGAAAQAPDVGCTETVSYSIPVVQTAYVTLTPDVQTEHVTLTPEIRTEYVTVTPQVQYVTRVETDYVTLTPDVQLGYITVTREAETAYVTLTPEVLTAYVTITPDAQVEHVTVTGEAETAYVTLTPEVATAFVTITPSPVIEHVTVTNAVYVTEHITAVETQVQTVEITQSCGVVTSLVEVGVTPTLTETVTVSATASCPPAAVATVTSTCTPTVTYKNRTADEVLEEIQQVVKELTVDRSNISRIRRMKESAKDSRPSATTMGMSASLFLAICGLLVFLLDIPRLHQDIRHFRRNLDINPDTEVQQESDKQ